MKKIAFISIVSFLFITSCTNKPSAMDLINTHKADAERKFEKLYNCYEIALVTPKVNEDLITWIPAVNPTAVYGNNNVYQIGIESFKDLSEPLDVPFDGTRRREHVDMAKLFEIDLTSRKQPHSYNLDWKYSYYDANELPDDACVSAIRHFIDSRYLLINRVSTIQQASVLDQVSYSEGIATGDVLVFDLEKEELIGGFQVNATSDDHMTLNEYADVESNLEADLEMNIYDMIKEKFRDLSPTMDRSVGIDF